MSSIRAFGPGVVIAGLMWTTLAQACDERFPWTCPASFDPPAVGMPVGDKADSAIQPRRVARPAAPEAVAKQTRRGVPPRTATVKMPPTRKVAGLRSAPKRAGLLHRPPLRPDLTIATEGRLPGLPAAAFEERSRVRVIGQEEVNELDLAAVTPVKVPTTSIRPAPGQIEVPKPFTGGVVSAPAPQVAAVLPQAPVRVAQPAVLPTPVAAAAQVAAPVASVAARMTDAAAAAAEPMVGAEQIAEAAAPIRNDGSDLSWLRKIFIALGSVLALASALRMFI